MTGYARRLRPGQRCRILTIGLDGAPPALAHESTERLYEAPNWTPNNELILNGDGVLWRLDPQGGTPRHIALTAVPELNNDHVISPDGETVYVSANDGHIYAAPLAGGQGQRVTPDDGLLHFLHGVSPDGKSLAYTGVLVGDGSLVSAHIYTMRFGATPIEVTRGGPDDGSEYSPDGAWLYYNTEDFASVPGHAQIARITSLGKSRQQLTLDGRVNWFPHLSPDGTLAYYLSYPPGTVGHPADEHVELRLVRNDDWSRPTTLASVFGGQGTANVSGWAPDSRRLAYVDYPMP